MVTIGDAHVDGAYHVDLAQGRLAIGIYPDRTLAVLDDDALTAVRFERILIATGAYERLPPIPGNDLPGVFGLNAIRTYGDSVNLPRGWRVAAWAPNYEADYARATLEGVDCDVVWLSDHAPSEIVGRTQVRGIRTLEREVACDAFIVAVSQPAIELALQAGATAQLTDGELPILTLDQIPEWMDVAGRAARQSSGVPAVPEADAAFVCLCEDVRVGDLKASVAQGFTQPELIKRRTGAMTGPCQGKLCSAAVLSTLRDLGLDAIPPRSRPLARPVRLGELAADA
jgi:hypothetical protein